MTLIKLKNTISEGFYFFVGLTLMLANRIRYAVFGYRRTREFSKEETEKSVEYDWAVVNNWLKRLKEYKPGFEIQDKTVLEIGPGTDIGTGVILLAKGATQYTAWDKNKLIDRSVASINNNILTFLRYKGLAGTELDALENEIVLFRNDRSESLRYFVSQESGNGPKDKKYDVIVSQAVFEHFENPAKELWKLSRLANSGTLLVSEVDLMTHTRFLRQRDPLNIYRYPKKIYDLLAFPESPNRWRPWRYAQCLKENGWDDIRIVPLLTLKEGELEPMGNNLAKEFRSHGNRMEILSFVILATKR